MKSIFFSTIEVTRQVFYRSPLSYAVVNLKPIVPGRVYFSCLQYLPDVAEYLYCTDVLVLPRRVVPRLRDLDASELSDLMASVQRVGTVIERVYGADALTIACQVRFTSFSLIIIQGDVTLLAGWKSGRPDYASRPLPPDAPQATRRPLRRKHG